MKELDAVTNTDSLTISLEYTSHDAFLAMLDKYAHVDSLFIPAHFFPLSTRLTIQLFVATETNPLLLQGIVAWSYPEEYVPKGRLAGIGVRLDPVLDSRWRRYLAGRVPSILATFPGDSVPLPSIPEEEIQLWQQRDRARSSGAVSTEDVNPFSPTHTISDFSATLVSSGRAGSGEAVRRASADANPPVKLPSPSTWTPDEIVNAKRPLPMPHRWPPAKPVEKVTTNTFSMEEVKEATDLVPTKSYGSAASRKTTAD